MPTESVKIPLGEAEGQRLEFKAAEALQDRKKIAREVVAMLNAEGGEVWIGLGEEAGRAVKVEPIEDAEKQARDLHDALIDRLEPSPGPGEVRIDQISLAEDRTSAILRILVTPVASRRPYACLSGNMRDFVLRVGARLRPMTREEIFSRPDRGQIDKARVDAEQALLEQREDALDEGFSGLWLAVLPYPPLSLNLDSPLLDELATDPTSSGSRRAGWNFSQARRRPEAYADGLWWGESHPTNDGRGWQTKAEIDFNGQARFRVNYEALAWGRFPVYPMALWEYSISALRLVARLYQAQHEGSSFAVAIDLALLQVGSRTLPSGPPGYPPYQPATLLEGSDALLSRPFSFTRDELIHEPDRCGFRLLQPIYRAFGMRESDMPNFFDRETGRLILKE